MRPYIFGILIFCMGLSGGQNQFDLSYHLPQNITYDSNIPTPSSVLGHQVGEWHVTHDKLVEYMKAISMASDRVSIEDRGNTFEGRPLLLLTITSAENHKNIDNIRLNHLKIIESKSNEISVEEMPLVVYQGFSIHGNEPSGSNASLLLAYYLAAAQGDAIEALLMDTVILLDPSLNPDGLQRFASWVNVNKSEHINPDPNDREYYEVWPKGRTNHYWFDLNRDWLPVQLPESRARINTYNEWMPNIVTDHHEMSANSTFFFQPGVQSRVHPLTPKANQDLTKEIANYHAKVLDEIGSLYFTEERFDDYYYGKGSTFPDINGAIGILFEQASSRGHAQETVNGLLTFPFTIRNQFKTALSTLMAGKDMRVKLLNYQKDFFNNVRIENTKSNFKAIVFGDEKDQAKTFHLAEVLKRHEIKFNKLKSDISINGKSFKRETSFIVPINQTKSKIVKAIFEKRTFFKDSLFYDISAWTYPMAFNLDYAELKSTNDIGVPVNSLVLQEGRVSSRSNYAYLMEWHEYYVPKALNKILDRGIRAKVGLKPFSLGNKSYDYGTILIPIQGQKLNDKDLFDFLVAVAKESSVNIQGVSTGLTKGIDLGSPQFKSLEDHKVAMVVGDGIRSYDAGEIWHLFDQRYQMNLSKLDMYRLKNVNLSKYSTLILPSGTPNLSSETIEKLMIWVKSGGTLIGYKDVVKWLVSKKFIELEFEKVAVPANNVTFEQKADFKGAQVIGGAIFEAELDRSHPINFGFKNKKLPMFRRTKIFIKPDSLSYNNPIKYANKPLLSGYVSEPNLNVLEGTVPFQVKKRGKGKVVVFTDNTNFRGFWYGTNKLLMNAIFFANLM
ncbi:M14 family metallopeptidase [Seonamhaeicola maritimus]|uniref:Zinc carboxypeptidase n=1 Tax=Seonamhaeicola maritimus TaxID=2591822 RepID=A0A5C7GLE8_9FLAO|nr:M14 family metallopeptidase [Seonamhaeicola maritimus]TXG39065.1 zinc carboxypeptidase [Seonamhaeicola maritimus]